MGRLHSKRAHPIAAGDRQEPQKQYWTLLERFSKPAQAI
jgi:hypothetical protein